SSDLRKRKLKVDEIGSLHLAQQVEKIRRRHGRAEPEPKAWRANHPNAADQFTRQRCKRLVRSDENACFIIWRLGKLTYEGLHPAKRRFVPLGEIKNALHPARRPSLIAHRPDKRRRKEEIDARSAMEAPIVL